MRTLITVCGKEIRITGGVVRIAQLEADSYHFLDDPESMVRELRKCGTRIDLFTFMQSLRGTSPKYSYPMELVNMAVVPISTYDNWWKQITTEARNRARQAEKRGVVIREVPFDDALAKGIWEIYNESPFRQGRPFAHYGKDFDSVRKEEATFLDTSFFIGAFFEDKLIGFVKLTTDENRTQANLMNILSTIGHREKAPTNALIAHSVRSCAERGISYLVYQKFYYGNKQRDGLMTFKKVNGFRSVDLPRYYVPLTGIGWAAYKAGLHHKVIDRLPAQLAARLRNMREAWYNRKQSSAQGAL